MQEIMREICRDFETELVEFNGQNNRVHLLVNFPPKIALAKLVNSLKGVSSGSFDSSSRTCAGTIAGPTSSGQPPTSPAPWAAHRPAASSSTSSSRTDRSKARWGLAALPRVPSPPP
jgi:Transposase IS200 like